MATIETITDPTKSDNHIVLQSLTISECQSICSLVIEILSDSADVFLELSSCELIDEAGFQLLALLKMDSSVSDRIHCSEPHPNIVAQAQQLGLSHWASGAMLESA